MKKRLNISWSELICNGEEAVLVEEARQWRMPSLWRRRGGGESV
jgi:hypothetical protein